MKEVEDGKISYIIRVIVLTAIMAAILGFATVQLIPIIKAKVDLNKLEVGDTFEVIYKSDDPFDNDYSWKGTVLDKDGKYVQYVRENGDTSSMNMHLAMQWYDVKVYKKE